MTNIKIERIIGGMSSIKEVMGVREVCNRFRVLNFEHVSMGLIAATIDANV